MERSTDPQVVMDIRFKMSFSACVVRAVNRTYRGHLVMLS